jgi:heme A synthase
MLHAHSGFRWLALILIIMTIIKAFKGIKNAEDYTAKNKMLALGTLIVFHLQFLIGFSLYFTGSKTKFFDMSQPYRFFTLEHPIMMIIAIILVTLGYSKAKKETYPSKKFRKILIYYTVALFIVIIAIPWPFRSQLASGWF